MCGKWNIRQATLQQMFEVTTFCMDTCFQSFSPLINCIAHHAVLKFSPYHNKTLPQLVYIADWYSIRVKKNEKDEKFVHSTKHRWTGSSPSTILGVIKLETLGYPMVKTTSLCVLSF